MSTQQTDQIQKDVDEVADIMHSNISKVMERGENLQSLHTKTEELAESSKQFKKTAITIERYIWWKDFKLKLIIVGIIAILIYLVYRRLGL